MKVLLIFDQGLAGAGGKTNPKVGLTAVKGGIGFASSLQSHFDKVDAHVLATLYCGNEFFLEHEEEVVTKMTAMVKKLNPDFVLCGPCFQYADYGKMAAEISANILEHTSISACAMMSKEVSDVIEEFKTKTPIVIMPKKGGTGLNDSIANLCSLMQASVNKSSDLQDIKAKVCY